MSDRFPEDHEHLVDPIDKASRTAEMHNAHSLAEVRRKAEPEQVKDTDGNWPITECVDCDGDLGGRLELGYVRCITCQEIKEKREKGRRHGLG